MRRILFNVASLASAVILLATIALIIVHRWVDPAPFRLSFGQEFHVSVTDGFGDELAGRLALFNDKDEGPYRGSMISVNGGPYPIKTGFGDTAGIYYRHFRWPSQKLWTLMVSLWYPLAISAPLPALWLWLRLGRKQKPGHCPACGYDCRASVATCPECGATLSDADTETAD